MLNAEALQSLLAGATEDTIVHLQYRAGGTKEVTAQALRELAQAKDWNGPDTSIYVGNFVGFRTNKLGEVILTLFVHNRGSVGQFRTFNPKVGTVLSAVVVPAS